MRARTLLPALLLLFTVACATNPVTGKREINLVSESQEIAMGREAHEQVVRQYGIYDEKPELNRLVSTIGHRLASESDRPNLPWNFAVLDTPMVNAMALPGGYIYITRGMLERINSEDELAGVLGHEIAHVTARHAAQRISRAQLAQFGMVLGAVVAGPQVLQQYGQIADLALTLLFQKYSRAQESQADLVGTQYMAEANYNPLGAERMLTTLLRLSQDRETSSLERYFESHPDPAKRVKDVQSKIAQLGPAMMSSATPINRDAYLRLTDGMITSNSTEDMVIRDGVVYDRAHGMIIRVPAGWEATTAPGTLFAMQPAGREANAQFVAQEVPASELQGYNAQQAVRVRFEQMGLQYAGSRQSQAGSGQQFTVDVWTGRTQAGQVAVETTQFAHGDHVAVFMFISPNITRSNSPLGSILQNTTVDLARARSIQPPRIRIGTVRSGESWADIARRATGDPRDAKAVAHMNGYDLPNNPPSGLTVKLPEDV